MDAGEILPNRWYRVTPLKTSKILCVTNYLLLSLLAVRIKGLRKGMKI